MRNIRKIILVNFTTTLLIFSLLENILTVFSTKIFQISDLCTNCHAFCSYTIFYFNFFIKKTICSYTIFYFNFFIKKTICITILKKGSVPCVGRGPRYT
jgi:hypothetical protein